MTGIGHVLGDLGVNGADFVVAGVHKWLGAGLPLGVGFGRHELIAEMRRANDDPLLALTSRNRSGARAVAETANVWPLISCRAAVAELRPAAVRLTRSFAVQLQNAEAVVEVLARSAWQSQMVDASVQSGILLARHREGLRSGRDAELWRRHFHSLGIELTSYPGPLVRISMPGRRFAEREFARLEAVFLA